MARYLGPKHKLCRAEGVAICGLPTCPVVRKNAGPPGQRGVKMRKKISEYGIQLREKQKVKRMYGVFERQFKKYYTLASRKKESTGDVLLKILETRLDNVIYRLGLARTRQQARQLVSHGHVTVNGKKVTIPSFNAKIGDVITVSPKAANFDLIKKVADETKEAVVPSWLSKKALVGRVEKFPQREEITEPIDERLIIEFYSR